MFNLFKTNVVGGSITMNGKTYRGNSVCIRNGVVTIDGKPTEDVSNQVEVSIHIDGNIKELNMSYGTVCVNGTVEQLSTSSGDVICGDVFGSVTTSSGDVKCSNVGCNVTTSSGDVTVTGSIAGSVKTVSGDITK